ncbi:DUF916 and DUF3324 domain-containing protein [Enterococcus faecium]|nr:DUF916 and DUF3324 domain-containing protein [Enterococcus faecium]
MLQHNVRKGWGRSFPLFFVGIVFFALFYLSTNIFADSNKVSFDARAILPDNQQSEASYYDLKVTPGATQDLSLKLKNTTAKQIKVVVEANNACTNKNGAIDYSNHEAKLLGKPVFQDLISKSQTITLKPSEERDVTFQLKIPEKGFEGTILGGFYCYEDTKGKEEKNEGFSLKNKFAYTIGVKLVCSDKKVEPEFALTKVKPGLENGYLTLFANLENSEPVLKSKMDLHAVIKKKGEKEALHEFNQKVSFAPRTQFQIPFNLNNEPLKKGTYELSIQLKDDSGKKWSLYKEFEIKGDDEKLNKDAVEVNKENKDHSLFYILLVLCLIIIISLIGYITKLRRKNP